MKKQFQSKSVPRGTRTIWRYLGALFILFTFAIGNVWAADPTHASPAIVKVANRNFLDLSSTPSNVTVSTDSYSNYGPGYFISNKNADLSKSWWGFSDTFKSSSSSYSNHKDAVGFHAVGSSSSSEFYQILQLREGSGRMVQMDFYVTGTTQIGFQWKNANTSGSKYLEFAIYEMNVSGTTATDGASPVSTIQGSTTSDADQYAASAALDGAKYYHVVVTPHNTSNINFYGLTFKHAPAASYTITYDANGGSGDAMESSTNTVSACTFTAPTGKEFKEWNTLATGLGDSYDPGDAASSDLDLFAIWQTKVEKFTVKYMDGTTELGSEVVEVGQHPTGSAITDPTKDCYTFAGWDPALNTVSGDDGDVVEVNATWTPIYSSSATLISDAVVSGKPNVNTVFAASNIVSSITFTSGNYEFTSNETKKGYYGYKDKNSGDYMKILLKQGRRVQVLFGNLGADPTIKINGADGALDASRSTGDNAENTFTYTASSEDALISITLGSGTNTLKKVDVSQLYNVTYTDETGDASGSASNVTEVTLPTPTETTVAGYEFTGWKANQTVTVGGEAKVANTLLNAGDVAVLSATTTFTAQWQVVTTKYAITKGTHTNGDFTISPASQQEAGGTVTLTATPNEDYLFDAWEVYKTGDPTTTVTVTSNAFTMPAYDVTVNATFAADSRPKVLYVTGNTADATKANDKLYAALKDTYNVKIVGPDSDADQSGYALVVLHESLNGGNDYNKTAVAAAKAGDVPVLNTKSFFYNTGRWAWGTPNAGQTVKGATMNSAAYCNIAVHPLFSGVTVSEGFFEITDDAVAKCMQPLGSFAEGKEGYTLATTPNNGEGNGCAIHELTPAQRGASAGKYLLISVLGDKLNALNANGQKLFQNAAAYLIGSSTWTPVIAPTLSSSVPANSAIDVAVAGNIVLTFSENVTVLDASKFTLSGGAGSLTTASISVSGAAVTIPYTGLDNSTEYTLATAAGAVKNGSDVPNAALSNIVFTTEAACTKPGAPASLVASDIAYTSATLSWDPSGAGTNGYEISIIKKDDETVILDWTYEATNSYEATGLTQGTEYTFKIKYKGDGITPGQCEFSNEVTVDFTTTAPSVADLVTIADDYTFTPSATIAAETLAESNKFFGAGTDDCDYGSGMRVKENRALAFKVNNGARVKVTFTTNGAREMQLGTDKADDDNKAYGHTKTSPATFDVTADGVVYLTASSDLRFSKLEIMYPHTVTYDLNGGTGTTPTQASKYVGETFSVHDGVTDITAPASKDFDKWVDQDAADVAAGATYTMPAKNVTLTAQWVDHIEPVDPTLTYDDGAYSVGGSALDLSSLITAQTSTGAITYSVKTDGGTSASIDGNNFTATAAGTATITASQAAVVGFNAKSVDFNVVVTEPTEKDGIKMVVAGVLTGNFRVKADQLKTGAYTVEGINYSKYVQMGSTHTSFGGETEGTQTKGIYYAPTKKNITFWFYMQNTESSTTRKIYVYTIEEGKAITSKTVDVEAGSHLVSTDITLTTNAEIVFGVENTKLYFCQIVAVESGDDLLQGGQNGYVFDYSKKRQNVAANTLRTIDGIDYKLSAESKINSASNVQLTTLGTHYIKFHLDAPMTVNVYADNKKYYVGTECSTEDAAKTYEATGDGEFTLAAGNWYINGSGAQVKINKLSFMLPKCEKPTITTQPATCHTFAPGSMTATVVAEVSDGGTLSYQWYNASDDSEVDGATAATLTTTTEGAYYVIVTNSLAGHQDNSTKSNEAELGYRVTNDATLMALSYGTPATAITLEDGVYTYAVELAKGTTDVPALAATATMDGYATVTISNAAEFVSYAASSTVTVKSEDATVTNVYTVNFTVKHDLPQVDVTASTVWNWANAATTMQTIKPAAKNVEQLMANIDDEGKQLKNDAEFNSQALIFSGQEALTGNSTRWYAKGGHIKFNVTVPGIVEVEFSDNGNNNRRVKINDAVSTVASASDTDVKTYKAYVQPGEVTLMGVKNDGTGVDQYIRISKITFTANPTPDYTRNVTNNIGTLCVDHNVLAGGAVGATFYQIASRNEQYNDKIDFEEVLPGEELKAGEPYIFQSTTGRIDLFYGATVADDPVAVRGMIGSFVNANVDIDEFNKNDILYIANNKLWNCDNLVGSHLNVVANRAYIVMSDVPTYAEYQAAQTSNPAPRRRVTLGKDAEQVATGCENLNVSDKPVKMIIDGQLFILRGEKMYDAKGQLVK